MTNIMPLQEVKNVISNKFTEEFGEDWKGAPIPKIAKDINNRIYKVLNGYGKREGFWSNLEGVFYRIWNAVKAIFAQSDWQKARNLLVTVQVKEMSGALNDVPEEGKVKLLRTFEKMMKVLAEVTLQAAVKATYIQAKNPEELIEEHKAIDKSFGKKAKKKLAPLIQETQKIKEKYKIYYYEG